MSARESQLVPPNSEFSPLYLIPAISDASAPGVPAGQFLRTFGDLYFNVGYDTNQMFARLVSEAEMDQQLSRLERNALPAWPGRRP